MNKFRSLTPRRFCFLATCSAFALVQTPAHAEWISATSAMASSTIADTTQYKRTPDLLIDGSGLNPDGGHTAYADTNSGSTMWLSAAGDPKPTVTFDLGRVTTLDQMHIWNYNEAYNGFTDRGVQNANVTFSTTDPFGLTNSAGDYTFTKADGSFDYKGEDYGFSAPITARYITLNILSNYGDSSPFYGLSEVRFNEVKSVPTPEPATWAMMAMGVAALAVLNWKRRDTGNPLEV